MSAVMVEADDPMAGVKPVARDLRSTFGDGVRLYAGSHKLHAQIDAGWRESIAVPPFGPKHAGWSP